MPFEWKTLVDQARELAEQAAGSAHPEGYFRSAVSRAYFGAYCHARNFANEFLQFEPHEDADDHGRLRAHLKGKRRKGDADRLEQLRQWRNDADYLNDLPWDDPAATVASAIQLADRVFSSLSPPAEST